MSGAAKMGCFTVNYEIKNFSIFLSKGGGTLVSPNIKSIISGKSTSWSLHVIYNGSGFLLKPDVIGGWCDSFFKLEGSLIPSSREIPNTSLIRCGCYKTTILKDKLLENRQAFLPDDTLTICCNICDEAIETGDIHIRTVLHQETFSWNIESFRTYDKYNTTVFEVEDLSFKVVLKRPGDKVTYTLKIKDEPNLNGYINFVECEPSILNYRAEFTYSASRGQRWDVKIFANSRTVTNPTFKLESILAVQRKFKDSSYSCVKCGKDMEATKPQLSSSLKEDLVHLYRDHLHGDATLKADGKSFPVHKSILSTRSEVFRSIFEKPEMKESPFCIVDIDDIDSDTVDRMLVFIYSDTFRDVNWQEASALYYAADKYAIFPLKKKCSDILTIGLLVDNACSAVGLADDRVSRKS